MVLMSKWKAGCPECYCTKLKQDAIHAETYCMQCGLVLKAPVSYGLVYPGFKKIYLKEK